MAPDPSFATAADMGHTLRAEVKRTRRVRLREPRKLHFIRATVVGVAAGLLAVAFQWSLFAAESARDFCLARLHAITSLGFLATAAAAALACGFAGWLLAAFAPAASGSGIPHIKGVLLRLRVLRWRAVIPVKFFGGMLCIGSGMSLGREGPTVQLGAAVGQAVSEFLHVPRRSRKHLIACGAGAGLAAAFNAPLAGFIFVLEELQRELSPITYGTALIGALVADYVSRALTGQMPSLHVSGYPAIPLKALPVALVLGVLAGLLGVVFNRGLLGSLRLFRRLDPWPVWKRMALAGAAAGLVVWWMPDTAGGGRLIGERLLRGEYSAPQFATFIVALLAVKFALTMISYGSGAPGGIFAPMLVLGAALGLLVGQAASIYVPSLVETPAAYAVIGMAALFTAAVRVPLTGIVLIVEMTGSFEQVFALGVASLTAYLVAEHLRDRPIYEVLLDDDLHRSGSKTDPDREPRLVDLVVEPHSYMDGRRVRSLGLPPGTLLVSVRRGGEEFVPVAQTSLQASDELVVILSSNSSTALAHLKQAARAP